MPSSIVVSSCFTFSVIALNLFCWTNAAVDVQPPEAIALENEEVSLLCRSGVPLNYCRFRIPGERVLNLGPNFARNDNFKYYGEGLDRGQCGVTIHKVKQQNNGVAHCDMGAEGDELNGEIPIFVAFSPLNPELEIDMGDKQQQDGGEFRADHELRVKCISRDGRPHSNLTWFLDDEPILTGLRITEIFETLDSNNITLYTSSQIMTRYLQPDDDGKMLTCKVQHYANRAINQEAKTKLIVRYGPQPLPNKKIKDLTLGKDVFLNVTLRASPRPLVEWHIEGMLIKEGDQTEKYSAYQALDRGHGEYEVSMKIAMLTLEDTTKSYYLRATNELGFQDYTIAISAIGADLESAFTMVDIVMIAFVVCILIVVLLLLFVAHAKQKWCFHDKHENGKENMGQTAATVTQAMATDNIIVNNIDEKLAIDDPMQQQLQGDNELLEKNDGAELSDKIAGSLVIAVDSSKTNTAV